MSTVIPRGTDSVKVIQVVVTVAMIGAGIEGDPARLITQYWSLDGALLAQKDEWKEQS